MDSRLIIIALVAYLLGSIPFGYILVKIFLKQDIRETGSGNIGATNVARSGKKGLAIATLLLDAGKGALAVFLAAGIRLLPGPERPETVGWDPTWTTAVVHNEIFVPLELAALFAIIGHCFPVWLRFKGGKGVATGLGAFVMIAPTATLQCVLIFAIVFAITRYVSLGSVISTAAFPFLAPISAPWLATWELMILRLVASIILILKHHGNIRRLIAGTEPKFGKKAIGTNDPIQTEKSI